MTTSSDATSPPLSVVWRLCVCPTFMVKASLVGADRGVVVVVGMRSDAAAETRLMVVNRW